ncbi:MAG: hypothetical protein AAF297_07260, partial [Planctomycetota bacterium]
MKLTSAIVALALAGGAHAQSFTTIFGPSTPVTPDGDGCDETCTLSHPNDGPCRVCGMHWSVHSGHFCPNGESRGSWRTVPRQPGP